MQLAQLTLRVVNRGIPMDFQLESETLGLSRYIRSNLKFSRYVTVH